MPTSGASTGFPTAREPVLQWRGEPIDPLTLATLPGHTLAAVVTVRGWTVVVADPITVIRDPRDLDLLGERCDWLGPEWTEGPPFAGGGVGYLTEDVVSEWLLLPPDRRPERCGLEAMWFAVHDSAICIPPDGEGAWLVAAHVPGWSRTEPASRLSHLATWYDRARHAPPPADHRPIGDATPVLSLDARAHRAAVGRIKRWIAAGDLYQLNLTMQVGVDWNGSGPDLARRLWAASPDAAHASWLDTGRSQIMSISPETFLRSDADQVRVRPIKGTRARRPDPREDASAATELLASAKDRAEHVMIVDLERNDLGRVCQYGSVHVPELMAVEEHPTVWHLTSTVAGTLRPGTGLGDLLRALFPCGSVTGAPKRMAVSRIRHVEPVRRGVYCGAIGVVTSGLVDLSVAIRTAVLHNGVARYGTGGGIVADSDESAEFDEAMDKAAAFLTAAGARRPASTGGGG